MGIKCRSLNVGWDARVVIVSNNAATCILHNSNYKNLIKFILFILNEIFMYIFYLSIILYNKLLYKLLIYALFFSARLF